LDLSRGALDFGDHLIPGPLLPGFACGERRISGMRTL